MLFDLLTVSYLHTSTSEVYKAQCEDGELFAIKVLPLGGEEDVEFAESEISILASIDSVHVIRLKESFVYTSPGKGCEIWIVLEYCDGGTVDFAYRG